MGPEITEHQGVQIRYGYNIVDDQYYAHFDLPDRSSVESTPHSFSKTYTFNGMFPGKQPAITAGTVDEVLKLTRSKIDCYFEE